LTGCWNDWAREPLEPAHFVTQSEVFMTKLLIALDIAPVAVNYWPLNIVVDLRLFKTEVSY